MRHVLMWILLLPCAALLVALSIANRQTVQLSIDPFNAANPNLSINLPLFVVISVSVIVGLLAGALIGWWQKVGVKRDLQTKRQEAEKLQRELFDTQNLLSAQQPGTFPVLPAWSSENK